MSDIEQHKRRLTAFYQRYAPEKVQQVEVAVDHFASQGSNALANMWRTLEAKYGPEETATTTPSNSSGGGIGNGDSSVAKDRAALTTDNVKGADDEEDEDYGRQKERLIAFYERYCPEKVPQVDKIIEFYKTSSFDELWKTLEAKYGPEDGSGVSAGELLERPKWMTDEDFNQKKELLAFYKHYQPSKLDSDINEIVRRHSSSNHNTSDDGYSTLWSNLEKKYGPRDLSKKPAESLEVPPWMTPEWLQHREALLIYYRDKTPEKDEIQLTTHVNDVLYRFRMMCDRDDKKGNADSSGTDLTGMHEALSNMWSALLQKYGPPPEACIIPALVESQHSSTSTTTLGVPVQGQEVESLGLQHHQQQTNSNSAKDLFDLYDDDSDGYVATSQLEAMIRSALTQEKLMEYEKKRGINSSSSCSIFSDIIAKYDGDNTGKLSFYDFVDIVEKEF